MTYAAPTFRTQSVPANFGGLVNDGNRNAMTGVLGSLMQTQDATGTPVTSPVTVNTTKTLVVPTAAAQCTVVSTTNAVQVSEDSTQTAFFTLPAGTVWTFDCARMSNIYLKTGSSTVVNFYFNLVP
jgi:hypothetical protein